EPDPATSDRIRGRPPEPQCVHPEEGERRHTEPGRDQRAGGRVPEETRRAHEVERVSIRAREGTLARDEIPLTEDGEPVPAHERGAEPERADRPERALVRPEREPCDRQAEKTIAEEAPTGVQHHERSAPEGQRQPG